MLKLLIYLLFLFMFIACGDDPNYIKHNESLGRDAGYSRHHGRRFSFPKFPPKNRRVIRPPKLEDSCPSGSTCQKVNVYYFCMGDDGRSPENARGCDLYNLDEYSCPDQLPIQEEPEDGGEPYCVCVSECEILSDQDSTG